ncbi:MAG: lactate utilization protein [Dehalococcoidia bacterium]|nr:lactate utilization protein [Dehalococcoidia bacterium]
MVQDFNRPLASEMSILKTVESLTQRNISALAVDSTDEAFKLLLTLVPSGSEVYCGTSETLISIGFPEYIRNNPDYRSLDREFESESDPRNKQELRRLSSISEYYIGSVQAISETGEVVVASSSGSQIGAYAFGAKHVILVSGTQKICPSLSDAMSRVRGYSTDKHDEWLAEKGIGPAPIGKLLILEKETQLGRLTVLLVRENLGW